MIYPERVLLITTLVALHQRYLGYSLRNLKNKRFVHKCLQNVEQWKSRWSRRRFIICRAVDFCGPKTRSVATGFGLATLTFDLKGRGACGWCGSSSSIRTPSLKFVGLAVRKIGARCVSSWMGLVTLIFDVLTFKLVCQSHQRWRTLIPNLGTIDFRVLELCAMYGTDGLTKAMLNAPFPTGGEHSSLIILWLAQCTGDLWSLDGEN